MYEEEECYAVDKNIVVRYRTMNFEFVCTCIACPEQYDVFLEGKQVGYVRLRWGGLRCDYPDYSGETIYYHGFMDGLQGLFDSDDERKHHLELIAQALYNKIFNAEHTAES